MSRRFSTPVTLAALLALLAGPALAQETAPAPQPPAAEAQAPVALPQALKDAGLTDVTSKRGRHDGSRIQGKLPDGTELDAMLDAQGQLRGLRARGEAVLPQALVAQLVPQAVRDNAVFAELGSLQAVFTGERAVMLAGQDAEKNKIRAAFAEDGTLLRFGRGDKEGPGFQDGKHRKHDRHGKRGDGWRDGHHGKARDHGKREGRGPDAPPPAGAAPDAAPAGEAAPQRQGAVIDRGALRLALTGAGYSRIGEIVQDGPRAVAQAVNPEGEAVSVEMNAEGRVLREINR
ncbi:hypothetical protein [Paracoccus aminovorans]|uniref:hypothetical protein n=1 Tax=Paracoccus aminovorans TaxID=34004 RepID=UPI002B257854|nr:hypothetical protein [Paracoccus aminovorans]